MTTITKTEYSEGRHDGYEQGASAKAHWVSDYDRLRALNAELVEALKMARPLIGYTGYYPTIMAQVEAVIAKAEKEGA